MKILNIKFSAFEEVLINYSQGISNYVLSEELKKIKILITSGENCNEDENIIKEELSKIIVDECLIYYKNRYKDELENRYNDVINNKYSKEEFLKKEEEMYENKECRYSFPSNFDPSIVMDIVRHNIPDHIKKLILNEKIKIKMFNNGISQTVAIYEDRPDVLIFIEFPSYQHPLNQYNRCLEDWIKLID